MSDDYRSLADSAAVALRNANAAVTAGHLVRVLVDDVRSFRDGRPAVVVRSSSAALDLLGTLASARVDELWLDYDLVGSGTTQPVVDHLVALAVAGAPLDVARIEVHSSNSREGHRICEELRMAGYEARRNFAARLWVHDWPS